jgi:hypothetical protein
VTVRQVPENLVKLPEEKIASTPDHLFFVEGIGWVAAGELDNSDRFVVVAGANGTSFADGASSNTALEAQHNAFAMHDGHMNDWTQFRVTGLGRVSAQIVQPTSKDTFLRSRDPTAPHSLDSPLSSPEAAVPMEAHSSLLSPTPHTTANTSALVSVYNVYAEDTHTYFVGESGLLVHACMGMNIDPENVLNAHTALFSKSINLSLDKPDESSRVLNGGQISHLEHQQQTHHPRSARSVASGLPRLAVLDTFTPALSLLYPLDGTKQTDNASQSAAPEWPAASRSHPTLTGSSNRPQPSPFKTHNMSHIFGPTAWRPGSLACLGLGEWIDVIGQFRNATVFLDHAAGRVAAVSHKQMRASVSEDGVLTCNASKLIAWEIDLRVRRGLEMPFAGTVTTDGHVYLTYLGLDLVEHFALTISAGKVLPRYVSEYEIQLESRKESRMGASAVLVCGSKRDRLCVTHVAYRCEDPRCFEVSG